MTWRVSGVKDGKIRRRTADTPAQAALMAATWRREGYENVVIEPVEDATPEQ